MPVLHKNIDVLRSKLAGTNETKIKKRIGRKNALAFVVNELRYDSTYPILSEAKVLRWKRPQQPQQSPPGQPLQPLSAPPTPPQEPQLSPQHEASPHEKSDASASPSSASPQRCQENIDCLLINDFVDEYRHLDDSEEEESEIAKRLKRIKSSTQTSKPAQEAQRLKPLQTLPQQKFTQQPPTRQPEAPQTANPQPVAPQQIIPPVPPVEKEPSWSDVRKQAEEGKYRLVLQQLSHFKELAMSNEDAKSALKAATRKCFGDDEAFFLIEFLDMIFEFKLTEKDFFSEVVGRLKRKINVHASVHAFKCKADPQIVMEHYNLALRKVAKYAKACDLQLTLTFSEFEMLTVLIMPATVPIKKEEPKEVPPDTRRVEHHTNPDGRPCFKITTRRIPNTDKRLGPNLI